MNNTYTILRLHELLAALDNRRAQPDRPGEAAIAADASALRARTLERLAELRCQASELS